MSQVFFYQGKTVQFPKWQEHHLRLFASINTWSYVHTDHVMHVQDRAKREFLKVIRVLEQNVEIRQISQILLQSFFFHSSIPVIDRLDVMHCKTVGTMWIRRDTSLSFEARSMATGFLRRAQKWT